MAKKKALIGESNYAEFEILNDFLNSRGYDVHWVKNGPDAVDQFRTFKPDLMILDALLPGMTGIKVCQAVRQQPGGDSVRTVLLSTVYKQFKEKYDSRKTIGVDAYAEKPVDVGELEKLVLTLFGDEQAAESSIGAENEALSVGKKAVGPSGTFDTTPFPKILFFLRKFNRTGALEVENEKINKVIYVQAGRLAYASSNQSSESLGRYMVQAGMLSVSDYNSSLEKILESGQQQGRVLLDMGVISPHQLYEALKGHLREKILSIFAWEAGKYHFRSGRLKLDNTLTVEIDLLEVLYTGIKRFYPLARLEGYFNEYKNHKIFRIKDSLYDRGELTLKPSEASFLKVINGEYSLGQLVARTKLSLTETFQLLYFLLLAEDIRFEGDTGLGDRSVSSQEDYIEGRKNRRQIMRDSAMDTELSGPDKLTRYREQASALFDQLETLSHFELLGLPDTAGARHVKAAYYRMVQIYHPSELYSQTDDITKAKADAIFRSLTTAYEVLVDETSRDEYLSTLSRPVSVEPETEVAIPMASSDSRLHPRNLFAPPSAEEEDEEPETDFDEEATELFDSSPESDALDEPEMAEENKEETAIFRDDSFDFGDASEDAESSADSIDAGISWDSEESFSEDDEPEDELDFSFDTPSDMEDELRVEEGRQVTQDMASIVKSELEYQKGEDFLGRQMFAEAADHFAKAVEFNPGEAEYHAYLGWSLFRAAPDNPESQKGAFETLEHSLTINPNLDTTHYFLGMLYSYRKEGAKARQSLQKALQFNPQNDKARAALDKLES